MIEVKCYVLNKNAKSYILELEGVNLVDNL